MKKNKIKMSRKKIGNVKILMRRNPERRKIWIYRREAEYLRDCGTGEGKR